jgi:hypothetical protein
MTDIPERIALRWEPGAAVTNGPLMTHPDYTRYVREDVAQTYHDAWLTAEGMLEEAQCQINAMKADTVQPRVKPLVWQRAPDGHPYDWQAWCDLMGGYYLATSEGAKREHEAVRAARILSSLVLP